MKFEIRSGVSPVGPIILSQQILHIQGFPSRTFDLDVLVGEIALVPAAAFVGGKVDEFGVGGVGGGGRFRRDFNGDDETAEVENLVEIKAAEAGEAPTHPAVGGDEDLMMRGSEEEGKKEEERGRRGARTGRSEKEEDERGRRRKEPGGAGRSRRRRRGGEGELANEELGKQRNTDERKGKKSEAVLENGEVQKETKAREEGRKGKERRRKERKKKEGKKKEGKKKEGRKE